MSQRGMATLRRNTFEPRRKMSSRALLSRLLRANCVAMANKQIQTKALIYSAPHVLAIETAEVSPPKAGELLVRTTWSGVSRGTEGLVFRNEVPKTEFDRMRAPHQRGDFPYPVVYGYAAVGDVIEIGEGVCEDWRFRRVFSLRPHQQLFTTSCADVIALPDAIPSRRAVLAANLETALNGLWDAAAGPGDRIAVVGVGGVGGLAATLASALPGVDLLLVDIDPRRAALADALGAAFATPDAAPDDFGADVVFHASASEGGLETALALAGQEARVVELSWYGAVRPAASFGAAFHARRLQLISSQVGQISPTRRPRWSYARRLGKAAALLADPRYDALITEVCAFDDAPSRAADWFSKGPDAHGMIAIQYPSG